MKRTQLTAFLKKLYFYKAFGYKYISQDFTKFATSDEFSNFADLNKQISNCSLCELCKTRNHAFCGQGRGKIMLLLENPSKSADISQDIFSGNIGSKLKTIIDNAFKEQDLYITFIIKCNVSTTKNINSEILSACIPYTFNEIKLLNPKLIITFGELASNIFTNSSSLQLSHGTIFKIANYNIMPVFSISDIITNPSKEDILINDLKKVSLFSI